MKKLFVILILFFSGSLVFSENAPVNIYLFRGPTAISMVKMIDDNTGFSENRAVNYNIVNSPDIMVSRIISGEADIAALPVNLAAKLYFKGLDYHIAAVTGYGLLYLLSSDKAVKTFDDIKGKDIYNSGRGSVPEFILDYLVKNTEAEPASVSYKYKHIELAQALINNMVKTAVLPEPFASKALIANKKLRIVADLQEEWAALNPESGKYPMTCFVVKKSFAQENPEALKLYFNKFRDAMSWIKDNREAAAKKVAINNLGFTYKESISAFNRLNFCFITGNEMENLLNAFYERMLKHGTKLIGRKLPDSALYYKFD